MVFYNDLAIGGRDSAELASSLERVLGKLRTAILSINHRKLFIWNYSIEFIGFKIQAENIYITEEQRRLAGLLQRPKTKKKLMSLLGFYSFL